MEVEGALGGALGETSGAVLPTKDKELRTVQGDDKSTFEATLVESLRADEASNAEGSQVCYGFRAYVSEEVNKGLVYGQSLLSCTCEVIYIVEDLEVGVPEVIIELAAATQLE